MAKLNGMSARTFQTGRNHDGLNDGPYYLGTFQGFAEVGYFRADWWAVCPKLNAGFGLSFCCGPDTRVYSEAELVEVFGSLARANELVVAAGGNVAKALSLLGDDDNDPVNAVYVGVDNGRWELSYTTESGRVDDVTFDGADLDGLKAWFERHGVREVATSSSVDFATEYEMPESTRDDLGAALSW